MFYSHEVLTSRKYGVATVWLVATLGSKSTLKKVSRKAILDVDVSKACETIVEPEAPMALRLQSNLLYGVTRVYLQQCGYVLADVESARAAIRTMLRSRKAAALEVEGGNRARADQLMLEDDPNFFPDLDLVPLDLELNPASYDTQSNLSPYGSSRRRSGSQHTIAELMLPPSNSSYVGGPVGGLDLLSTHGDSGPGRKLEPPRLLEDDLGLMLDDECGLPSQPIRHSSPPFGENGRTDPINDYGALELYSELPPIVSADNAGFTIDRDDGYVFEPGDAKASQQDAMQGIVQQHSSAVSAVASIGRKKRTPKTMTLDMETTLRNKALADWGRDYLDRMRDAIQSKQGAKLAGLARKNAEHWVLGTGSSLYQTVFGPLKIFTGAAMIEAFTHVKLGRKRQRDNRDDLSDSGRRVRARGEPAAEETAKGSQDIQLTDGVFQDDGYAPIANDDTIEQGREAPTPLDDQHWSSIFPWNQSAGSRRPTDAHPTSASIGIGGPQLNILGRRGSRLTSASPLIGRGTSGMVNVDDFELLPGSDVDMGGMTGDEAFELFGPAAQVDTQTAGQSQWQRAALGSESANFLDFVRNKMEERDVEDKELHGSIEFAHLLPPKDNSQIVAAQAMLHVLTLATKNLLEVQQARPFSSIHLRVIAA